MSVAEELKTAVVNEAGLAAWRAILDNNDSELAELVFDGDMSAFLGSLEISDLGISAAQYANIVAANPAPPSQVPPSETVYFYFPVWAEESGGLSANNAQWSYGNGATGNIGIPVVGCEVIALSFNAEVFGSSVTMRLRRNNSTVQTETFTSNNGYIELASPVSFSQGDLLGFQTDSFSGTNSDARITAWCRVPISAPVVKGDKGDPGVDGMGGAPNAYARIPLVSGGNINTSSYSTIALSGTPTMDTVGISVAGNIITAPAGTYEVRIVGNVSSSVQRPNQEIRMLLGGSEYSTEFGEGYVRSGGGHNEAKVSYGDIVTLASTDTLEFQSRQIAASGTVTLQGGKVLLHKLA